MTTAIDADLDLGGRISLQDGFTGVAAKISSSFTSMRTLFSSGAGFIGRAINSMTGGLGGAGRYLLGGGGIIAGLGALTRAAVNAGSSMENSRIGFETLLGSSEKANAHLEALRDFAIGKPFEFTELTGISRDLQSFGFQVKDILDPLNEGAGLIKDFGDAAFAAGTGREGINRMVRSFGTMHATGKVTMGNLRMLVLAGVPAFQMLQDELGLTGEQVRNIAKSGIPAEKIIAALRAGMQKRFDGGMAKASQTITAKLSDLADVAEKFLTVVGDELKPTIKGFLDEFSSGLGKVDFKAFGKAVADVLSTVMRLLRIVVQPFIGAFGDVGRRWAADTNSAGRSLIGFAKAIRDVVQGVMELVSSSNENGVASIPAKLKRYLIDRGFWPITMRIAIWVNRVRSLIRGFILGLGNPFASFMATVVGVGRALGIVTGQLGLNGKSFEQIGRTLGVMIAWYLKYRAIMAAVSVAMAVARVATMAWTAVQWLLNVAMSANPIGAIIVAVVALGAAIALLIVYWDEVKAALLRVWAPVAAWFGRLWQGIKNAFARGVAAIVNFFSPVVAAVRTVIGVLARVFAIPIMVFKRAFAVIKTVGKVVILAIYTSAVMGLMNAWSILKRAFAVVATFFRGIYDRVTSIVGGIVAVVRFIWSTMKVPFVAAWNFLIGILNTVKGKFAKFWDAIKGMGQGVWDWIKGLFNSLVDVVIGPIRWVVRQVLALFDALPEWARPGMLQNMANSLRSFADGDKPNAAPGEGAPDGNPSSPSFLDRVRTRVAERNVRAGSPTVNIAAPTLPPDTRPIVLRATIEARGRVLGEVVATHNELDAQRQGR